MVLPHIERQLLQNCMQRNASPYGRVHEVHGIRTGDLAFQNAITCIIGLRAVAVLTGHGSRFTATVTVP